MKKLCVLITMNFPYNSGEIFIENEISYLATYFDKVVILSLTAKENDAMTRKIPENVLIFPLGNDSSKFRYLDFLLKGLLYLNRDNVQEVIKQAKMSAKGAVVYALGRYNSSFKKCKKFLDKSIEWSQFDFCVFYSYWFMDQAMLANKLKVYYSDKTNVKSVSRAHGYDLYENRNKAGIIPFREKTLEEIDGVFPCSEDGVKYLVGKYPKFKEKINASYLGTKDFGVQKKTKKKTFINIVSCSNIIALKRVNLIAEAIGSLVSSGYNNIRWTCIGDGPLLSTLKETVNDLGIKKFVEFKGRLENKVVINYYQNNKVDLFINVSSSEGLPVSIMEAQSFGIPCMATDVGGTKEIVNNNVGFLLPSDLTPLILTDSIKKFILAPEEVIEELRLKSRSNWEEKFSATKNYQEWCQIIGNNE